jgi:peroxisomal 3,2-trans-enoyl-CoA isomerase
MRTVCKRILLPRQNSIHLRRLLHTETISTYETILLSHSHNNEIATITLNRPKKKNAYSKAMYTELDTTLRILSDDKKLKVILLTGAGDYFSSGNDLSNFSQIMHPLTIAKETREICYSFVDSFISCRKPIVVAVNGPSFGIAVTTLGLCDTRFSSDTAFFKTPFAELGQVWL